MSEAEDSKFYGVTVPPIEADFKDTEPSSHLVCVGMEEVKPRPQLVDAPFTSEQWSAWVENAAKDAANEVEKRRMQCSELAASVIKNDLEEAVRYATVCGDKSFKWSLGDSERARAVAEMLVCMGFDVDVMGRRILVKW